MNARTGRIQMGQGTVFPTRLHVRPAKTDLRTLGILSYPESVM